MTASLRLTPTCGAARPMPGAFLTVSFIFVMSFFTSAERGNVTARFVARRTGSSTGRVWSLKIFGIIYCSTFDSVSIPRRCDPLVGGPACSSSLSLGVEDRTGREAISQTLGLLRRLCLLAKTGRDYQRTAGSGSSSAPPTARRRDEESIGALVANLTRSSH